MFKAESYSGCKLCWPGDLVINSLWAWVGELGVSRYHGIVSSAYGVYRLLPKFKEYSQLIHFLVRSVPFQWELQVRSKGIWLSRLQLTDTSFLGAPFPSPPRADSHRRPPRQSHCRHQCRHRHRPPPSRTHAAIPCQLHRPHRHRQARHPRRCRADRHGNVAKIRYTRENAGAWYCEMGMTA